MFAFWQADPPQAALVFVAVLFGVCTWIARWPAVSEDDRRTNHGIALLLAVLGLVGLLVMIVLTAQYQWALTVLP